MARTKRRREDDPALWKTVGFGLVATCTFPLALTALPLWGCYLLLRRALTTRERDDLGIALFLVPALTAAAGLNASFWSAVVAIDDPGADRGSFNQIPGMWGHVVEGCRVTSQTALSIARSAFDVAMAALALTVIGFLIGQLLVRREAA